MAAITQLTPAGVAGRRYGAFGVPSPPAPNRFERGGGIFPERRPGDLLLQPLFFYCAITPRLILSPILAIALGRVLAGMRIGLSPLTAVQRLAVDVEARWMGTIRQRGLAPMTVRTRAALVLHGPIISSWVPLKLRADVRLESLQALKLRRWTQEAAGLLGLLDMEVLDSYSGTKQPVQAGEKNGSGGTPS